jgi:hypothetical protein
MTEYVILTETEDGGWRQNGIATASSPARALREAGVSAGNHVAVPRRSWKPLKVKVETTTKIKIG